MCALGGPGRAQRIVLRQALDDNQILSDPAAWFGLLARHVGAGSRDHAGHAGYHWGKGLINAFEHANMVESCVDCNSAAAWQSLDEISLHLQIRIVAGGAIYFWVAAQKHDGSVTSQGDSDLRA